MAAADPPMILPPLPPPLRTPEMLVAAAKVFGRRFAAELYGAPGYNLTLKGPRSEGFAAGPRDMRPTSSAMARAVLTGKFQLTGLVMQSRLGEEIWAQACPDRAFAVELHRFAWLPHLAAAGLEGGREAFRLCVSWVRHFGLWSDFSWSREVLSRRVFNLACAGRRISAEAAPQDTLRLADSLYRQAHHLLRLPFERSTAAAEACAAALAGCALAGRSGTRLRRKAFGKLKRALKRSIDADGVLRTRDPEAGLELLHDLLALDDGLLQRGLPTPPFLLEALRHLSRGVRGLTLPDGRLAAFHGGEPADPERVGSALALDDDGLEAEDAMEVGGYVRLGGNDLFAIVDAAPAPDGSLSLAACDQPMAIEVVAGRDRLIVGGGWSPRLVDKAPFRLISAASTISVAETSPREILRGRLARLLGSRLKSNAYRVRRQVADGPNGRLVAMAHDGYLRRFGLILERRVYLAAGQTEIRGEDKIVPVKKRPLAPAYPATVRFLLAPNVRASLARDRRSVLMIGPSEQGWRLRADAPELSIEPSQVFERGRPRRTQCIVLRLTARTDKPTRVRWKIEAASEAHAAEAE